MAYSQTQQGDASQSDVMVLDIQENSEIPFVVHPADDKLMGWSPDGKWILFLSDRTGTEDAWVQAVNEGRPKGWPKRVKKNLGDIGPLGFIQDGSFYFSSRLSTGEIHVAELSQPEGILSDSVTRAGQRAKKEQVCYPGWSHDGQFLAYPVLRSGELIIESLATGEVREISTGLSMFWDLQWSPDRKYISVCGRPPGIHKIDLETGKTSALIDNVSGWYYFHAQYSPDRKTMFIRRDDRFGEGKRIIKRDLESGSEEEIYSDESMTRPIALSPDGRWIAFGVNPGDSSYNSNTDGGAALKVIPSAGGRPRELVNLESNVIRWFDWMPDGPSLIYSRSEREGTSFWRIPLEGGTPRKLAYQPLEIYFFDIDPDGQRIAYSVQQKHNTQLWAMENFLP